MNKAYEEGMAFFARTDTTGIRAVTESLADLAPHISRYIIEVFGQLFSRPVLTERERELVVIAALTALGDTPSQLKWHMNFGLKVGLTPQELVEIATQLIPFCGFPRALNAIGTAKQLFAEQALDVRLTDELAECADERRARGLSKLAEIDGAHGEEVVAALEETAPLLAQQIVELAFGEIYCRSGLTNRQRQLATIAALAVQGGCEPQLTVHLHAGLRVGLTAEAIVETLLQCAPYAGFPKVLNALATAKRMFAA